MRPRKRIVVLARTQAELSDWRFKLELAGYAVTGATTLKAARELEIEITPDAVMTLLPGNLSIRLLQAGGRFKVLLADCTPEEAEGTAAEMFVLRGKRVVEHVRDALRVMVARKRGPKRAGSQCELQAKRGAATAIRAKEAARLAAGKVAA